MSRKSVLGALCAGHGTLETATRRMAGRGSRTFTSTASRHAHITYFTPTSSKDLDELLNTVRHKIILPSYLPQAQRKKIYSPKYEKALQSDPVIIEIDGEVLKFRHMNPLAGDIPETRRSVMDAVSRFRTADDFVNLQPLLEGLYYTGRKFDPGFYAKIVRIAGQRGRVYDALACARMARRTGLRLDSSEKANEVLHFVQFKAVDAGFAPEDTARALRWAELVVDMLADEQHQPRRRKDELPIEGELPLDRDPQVLLARLHLAAALARGRRAEGGDEAEAVVEKVNKYAADVVGVWPEGKRLKDLQPAALYEDEDKMGYLLEPNKFVVLAAPLLYGIETAIDVVEPELADQLRSRRDALEAEVQEARAAYGMKPGRGEAVYQKLYGAQAGSGEPLYQKVSGTRPGGGT
ncbi:hypothetical protein DL766_007203 [Monosporascus sp. MC13-8B]|nr:hypothetical protein DL763_005577 [Monosporascus cannonballus]RYP24865.1 hypothetical protein DL766_007203 [Monosporascus sp. MC13-8B]